MKYIPAILLFLCMFVGTALAATTAENIDPGLLDNLYNAVVHGQFGWLTGLGLILAIEPAKRLLLSRIKFLETKLGGVLLAFTMAAVAGSAHALIVGATWNLALVSAIARNALVAIGGYTAIKRMLVDRYPWLEKIVGKALPAKPLTPVPLPSGGG